MLWLFDFQSYPVQTKIKLISSPATNTFASIYFNNFSILYLCIFLSIYPSTLSMLHYIINATVNNLCRIISATLYHINATLHYQYCITYQWLTATSYQHCITSWMLYYIINASLHPKHCSILPTLHHTINTVVQNGTETSLSSIT